MLIPSGEGDGMFSKVGRYTTEKFFILRKKDEILFGKRVKHDGKAPEFKVSAKVREYLDELEKKRKIDNMLKLEKGGPEFSSNPNLAPHAPEPFKVMIGRDDLDAIGRPSSRYRPRTGKIVAVGPVDKTLGILPHQPTVKLIKPTRPQSASPGTRETYLSKHLPLTKEPMRKEDFDFNPDKLKPPIPGSVVLQKPVNRRLIQEEAVDNADFRQFEVKTLPRSSSNYRYIRLHIDQSVLLIWRNLPNAEDSTMRKTIFRITSLTSSTYRSESAVLY